MQQDHPLKILLVATSLCLICSALVSTAAIKLRPLQMRNAKLDLQKKLLLIGGLLEDPKALPEDIEMAFQRVEIEKVILPSGEEKEIYLVRSEGGGGLDQIILPVSGKGLWSTMKGFIALEKDTRTVRGFGFYEHGETPGLGGEVDNPRWRAQWKGKEVLGDSFEVVVDVLKGKVNAESPEAKYQIDGLSGATITARGVEALLHHWLGPQGYALYLASIREMSQEEEVIRKGENGKKAREQRDGK